MNQVNMIGNLTKDPEMRYTPDGTAVTSFRIATDNGRDNDPDFHNIVVWGPKRSEGRDGTKSEGMAGLCGAYLKKGSKVAVFNARLTANRWTDKDGVDREKAEVCVFPGVGNVEFLTPKEKTGAQS